MGRSVGWATSPRRPRRHWFLPDRAWRCARNPDLGDRRRGGQRLRVERVRLLRRRRRRGQRCGLGRGPGDERCRRRLPPATAAAPIRATSAAGRPAARGRGSGPGVPAGRPAGWGPAAPWATGGGEPASRRAALSGRRGPGRHRPRARRPHHAGGPPQRSSRRPGRPAFRATTGGRAAVGRPSLAPAVRPAPEVGGRAPSAPDRVECRPQPARSAVQRRSQPRATAGGFRACRQPAPGRLSERIA